jgi:hypothetical protein
VNSNSHQTKIKLAQALRLIADVIEVDETPDTPSAPEWVDEGVIYSRWGIKKNGLISMGLPPTRIGRKNRWNSQALEAAFQAKPPRQRAKVIQARQLDDEDPLESLIRSGAVVARGAR